MTQEHPQVICNACQTPLADPAAQVAGEYYCRECAPGVVRDAFG
jgi:formylmethanofuran dehydrogenase subunit E